MAKGLRPRLGVPSLVTSRCRTGPRHVTHIPRSDHGAVPLPCDLVDTASGDRWAACQGQVCSQPAADRPSVLQHCREAAATVTTHTLARDLNVGSALSDARRIEVVANGLPVFGGAQLAVDATHVSALTSTVYTYVCSTCAHMCVPIRHVFVFRVGRRVPHVNTLVCAR